MTSGLTDTHFLIAPGAFWGHLRPNTAFALSLVHRFPTLYITLAHYPALTQTLESEITRFGVNDAQRSRVKLVPVGNLLDASNDNPFARLIAFEEAYGSFARSLLSLDPQGSAFEKRPGLFLGDFFHGTFCKETKRQALELGVTCPPVYLAVSQTASAIACRFALPEHGGLISRMLQRRGKWLREQPEKYSEMTEEEILAEAHEYSDGELIDNLGAPSIYDYETHPQLVAFHLLGPDMPPLVKAGLNILQADSIVATTSPAFEHGAIPSTAKKLGRPFLQIGPPLPKPWWDGNFAETADGPGALTSDDREALDFLDQCQAKYGEKSVIFISFGTMWIPARDNLHLLVRSLGAVEPPLPFLFAMPESGPASFGLEELRLEIAQLGGLGKAVKWAPQVKVLSHPATGWFLTHGGSNSTSEAVLTTTPMIFWPVSIDQPQIAAQMTVTHRASYELIQVRNGPSIGKPTRRGLVVEGTPEAMRAEMDSLWKTMRAGSAQRDMIDRLAKMRAEWKKDRFEPGGESFKAFEHFGTLVDQPAAMESHR